MAAAEAMADALASQSVMTSASHVIAHPSNRRTAIGVRIDVVVIFFCTDFSPAAAAGGLARLAGVFA
jgi:hypothetical protein